MKKTFLLTGVAFLLFSLAINAQDTTANKPVTPTTRDTMSNPQTQPMSNPAQTQPTTQQKSNPSQSQPTTQEQKKYGNPTVDSILSKYSLVPMPNQMTTEQIFPVIGQYQSSTNSNEKLTITLDDQNKGLVWIDGLPQGKVKGVLKKSPSTYKIPAQKTAEGNDVPEGTLIYDKDTKVITVMIGRPFNDQDPASVFATANTTTNNDQTQSTTTNDQTTTTDQSKMNNDQSKMKANATKTKTVHNKTKTKMKKPEEPAPYVFTGTKIEQVTANNQ